MILPLRLPLRLTLAAQALADPQHHNCFHQYVSDGGGLAFLPASFFYRSPFSATATSMSLRLGHERLHSASIGGGISPRQPQRHRQHQHRSGTTSSSFGTLPPENFMPSCRACRSLTSSTVVLKTAVGQDSGEEAQQASLNLQQQAGRRGHALRSPAAKEYYQRKRDMLRAEEDLIRDKCERCRRARKLCLCSSLPAESIPTSTRFVILQHPAETKRRITGTVPLVLHCLSNCRRVVMHSTPGMAPDENDLRSILGVGRGGEGEPSCLEESPLLLFPCPGAEFLEDIAADGQQSSTTASAPRGVDIDSTAHHSAVQEEGARQPASTPSLRPTVVVVIDGTWSQAKQILSRYPFLSSEKPSVVGPGSRGYKSPVPGISTAGNGQCDSGEVGEEQGEGEGTGENGGALNPGRKGEGGVVGVEGALCRAVKFRSAGSSSYGFRREPSKECLSTLESVAYTLEVLEPTPEGVVAASYLRKAFSAMVAAQLQARDTIGQPRFVDRKSRTANRRSTPKNDVRKGVST